MGNIHNELLALVKETLLYTQELKDPLFTSAEELDYYRKLYRKKEVPTPIAAPPPPPPPLPLPKPVVIEKPKPVEQAPKAIPIEPPKVEKPIAVFNKELKQLFAKIAPELAVIDAIPSDALAKKINTRWKTKNQTAPITLLYYQELPEHKALLEQIGKALDVVFGPARLISAESIEKEKQWEALLSVPELKLIVCCDYTLWQLQNLMTHYKEVPAQQIRTLKDKPVFLLPDLSLYLKDPLLKRSLWKGLCQTCASLPSS